MAYSLGMTGSARGRLSIGGRAFEWGVRTYVMGIINVSPESFSGDGVVDTQAAVDQAHRFAEEGADILDVGGQSTRPGFAEITIEHEVDRVVPVVRRLAQALDLPISVDTYRYEVAAAALDAGANMINDIWGFRSDPRMAHLCAVRRVPAVLMHNQRGREPVDVIEGIKAGLRASIDVARLAGLAQDDLIMDPGFGFGWRRDQNLEMLRRLGELREIGLPILVGTSRKSTIGDVLDRPVDDRKWGTAATIAIAIANGADIVRVHDVAEMAQVCRMADAVVRTAPAPGG
jgi:dihydropteroate synthase